MFLQKGEEADSKVLGLGSGSLSSSYSTNVWMRAT
jgi:hypothetical protein